MSMVQRFGGRVVVCRSRVLVRARVLARVAPQTFVTPEVLTGSESWYCAKCKRATEAVKTMSIFRCPVVLVSCKGARAAACTPRFTRGCGVLFDMQVVHLKRFSFTAFRRTKIGSPVRLPLRGFRLTDYIHDDCASARARPDSG